MCRIGMKEPEPAYLKFVIKLTENPYFLGIMGGIPKKAYYVVKHKEGHFGYLDPHQTLKAVMSY